MRGFGFGLIGNIVVGIVGAFVGACPSRQARHLLGGGYIAWIINATIGAVILLVIIGLIRKAT